MEVRLTSLDAMLAVVTRTKREHHTIGKRGGKVASSVDSRVTFTFKQAAFKANTDITLEVL